MTSTIRVYSFIALVGAVSVIRAQGADSNAPAAVEKVTVRATAHFDFDRNNVLPVDQQRLLSEVATMKDVTWRTVSAKGYTDSVGAPDYNVRLSRRRAEAVQAFLVGKGLDPKMIAASGGGAAEPVADNASAEGRARNRRTEVVFEGVRAGGAAGR